MKICSKAPVVGLNILLIGTLGVIITVAAGNEGEEEQHDGAKESDVHGISPLFSGSSNYIQHLAGFHQWQTPFILADLFLRKIWRVPRNLAARRKKEKGEGVSSAR